MISPKEIQEQCSKKWKDFLVAWLQGRPFFPIEINRIGKVTSAETILSNRTAYIDSIELLRKQSKEYKKNGYIVIFEEKNFNRIGKQSIPDKIIIETSDDFLFLIDKIQDFKKFQHNYTLISNQLPILMEWALQNPLKLVEHTTWIDTLKVCRYFMQNPQPNLYIRQLPIDVHTKYIIENKTIIQSLLDFLIPQYTNIYESKFEQRFNLKYAEPLIRIRFLDVNHAPIGSFTDLSLPLSEFRNLPLTVEKVFVTENLMNFLTLPPIANAVALWSGGGFSVSYLRDIESLTNLRFYYWGDLDAQGFQILNQFRTYFPNTTALMMDKETLDTFPPAIGQPTSLQNLPNLTAEEYDLYQHLQKNNLRLEQEKISQSYVIRYGLSNIY